MQTEVRAREDGSGAAYVTMPTGVFQFAASPLSLQDTEIGSLQLANALDGRYAHELCEAVGRGDAHRVGQRGDCEHAADRADRGS